MSDVVVSPNMNLPVPVVSQEIGPDWATDVNACLRDHIDSHDHSTGQGVQIGVAGINVDGNLTLNSNNLTSANSVGFSALLAAVTTLLRTLQVVNKDLYYIDGDGNAVRITQGGSVTGATGTITGLPSGTASAAYSGGTFTFNSATNTKATMSVGPVAVGSTTASGKQTTISSAGAMPANLSLVLPQAAGAANSIFTNDGSSNTTWSPITTVLAAAGIGASSVTNAQLVSISALTETTLGSLSLTAGTYILSGSCYFTVGPGGSTNVGCGVSIGTNPASVTGTLGLDWNQAILTSGNGMVHVPFYIVSPGTTTTYYFNGEAVLSGTTSSSFSAVRIA